MLNHGIEKCRICDNYLAGADTCKFCHFEWARDYPPTDDVEWDILNLDDNIEWTHLQILDRLHYKGIECLMTDIWYDSNLAYLIGVHADTDKVARALGVHKEIIFNDIEHGWMILNLFMEKYLRGDLDDREHS